MIVVDDLQLSEAFEYGTFAGTAISKSSATEIFSYLNSTRGVHSQFLLFSHVYIDSFGSSNYSVVVYNLPSLVIIEILLQQLLHLRWLEMRSRPLLLHLFHQEHSQGK